MNGYESLRSSAAWINLSDRGLIRATGEDRARLLHAMTTNDIQRLAHNQGCYVFFLSAQGRILADANVYNLGESLLIDTEPETGAKIYAHLDKFIIADDVTLADESGGWAIVSIEGPLSEEILRSLGAPMPANDYGNTSWGDRIVAKHSVTGLPGSRIFLPVDQLDEFRKHLESAGVVEADAEAVRTVRLEHGRPRYGEDITERYLAQETNQMHSISFSKGCYLGQEIVERVRSRAQIHRMLSPVRIHCRIPPEPHTKLRVNDKDVAEITSAVFSPALGEVAALAYVRVEQLQAKSEMIVAGTEPVVRASIP